MAREGLVGSRVDGEAGGLTGKPGIGIAGKITIKIGTENYGTEKVEIEV